MRAFLEITEQGAPPETAGPWLRMQLEALQASAGYCGFALRVEGQPTEAPRVEDDPPAADSTPTPTTETAEEAQTPGAGADEPHQEESL